VTRVQIPAGALFSSTISIHGAVFAQRRAVSKSTPKRLWKAAHPSYSQYTNPQN